MIRIFTGFDQREARGWHSFAQSVIDNTPGVFSITPLTMNGQRDGTNAFTYSRFLVPYLCEFKGYALFVDGADMIAQADLSEIWKLRTSGHAAWVVKHDYRTKFPRKYLGTEMEADNSDYPRKNWSSVILWDCAHFMNRVLTPEFVAGKDGAYLHRFSWLPDDRIGDLPREWNWLADEYGVNADAKILHYTAGIPGIRAHNKVAHAQSWFYHDARANEVPAEMRIAEMASAR